MKNKLWMVFLSMGIISMVYGISRSEAGIVLIKSINICLECIGIG